MHPIPPNVASWAFTDAQGFTFQGSLIFYHTPTLQGTFSLAPEDCEPAAPAEIEIIQVLLQGTTSPQGEFLPSHPINIVDILSEATLHDIESFILQTRDPS